MVRAVIQYEREPDPERYARHVEEFAPKSTARRSGTGRRSARPSASRRSRTTPSSSGTRLDAFKTAARSDEFAASGKDAMEMGIPFTVTFVEVA